MDRFDVAVVGAGPAGASAAHALARGGLRVALLEKAALPRYKTCGGGLVGRARKLLPADARYETERDCHAAELHVAGLDLAFTVRRSSPVVSMVMRSELDRGLAEAARAGGAELRAPCEVNGLAFGRDAAELATSQGALSASFVVAADGALSPVAKLAGWRGAPLRIPALEWEVRVPRADFERCAGAARFDFGIPEEGYAWIFPKRDHLSVGVLSTRPGAAGLPEQLRAYLAHAGLRTIESAETHGFVIPCRPHAEGFAKERVLLAGDAAGLVDPLTLEGISFALESGRLAAEALLESQLDPPRARALYERSLRARILPELRAARLLARVLYRSPRIRAAVFRRHGQRVCEAVCDAIAGTRSYREMLLSPRSYWKLLASR